MTRKVKLYKKDKTSLKINLNYPKRQGRGERVLSAGSIIESDGAKGPEAAAATVRDMRVRVVHPLGKRAPNLPRLPR